jgi:hypothetical protein
MKDKINFRCMLHEITLISQGNINYISVKVLNFAYYITI